MSENSETATRIVVSYPADLSGWGRDRIDTTPFKTYLRRMHTEIEEGETWNEFVDSGCCGDTLDIPLQVETIDGPSTVGTDTKIEYAERKETGVEGGWLVQSAAGPSNS